jgi:predicted lipoprotein with Yx(FWY)xxD motif
MRKSGWAVAAGLASAALLLTACGGSSSSSTTAGGSSSSTPSTGAASTNQPNAQASGQVSSPPPGAVYLGVAHAGKGWGMTTGAGQVVYTYAGDTAGKAPTCTGSCAAQWPPLDGTGLTSLADHTLPGKFGQINGQITYNGLPLYTYKGALPYTSHAGGEWKTVPLPTSLLIGN